MRIALRARPFNFRPLCFGVLLLVAGILLSLICLDSYIARSVTVIAALAVTAALLVFGKYALTLFPVMFITGFLTLSGACDIYRSNIIASAEPLPASARVVEAVYSDDHPFYIVDSLVVDGAQVKGKMRLYSYAALSVGDVISFESAFAADDFMQDEYFVNDYRKQIYYTAFVSAPEVTDNVSVPLAYRLRHRLKTVLYSDMRGESADIVLGLLLGDKSQADANLYSDVKAGGIAHLFAVSGLHVGFLAAALTLLLSRSRRGRVLLPALIPSGLAFYAYLCGFPASVVRAVIMCTVGLLARTTGYKNDPLTTLFAAGGADLILFPTDLFSVGFQLSFLSVAGIILFVRPRFSNAKTTLSSLAFTSVATTAMTFPVIASVFGEFSLLFLPVNCLILPIMPFIYVFLLINSVLMLIFPFLSGLYLLNELLVLPLKLLSFSAGALAFSVVSVPSSGLLTAAYYFLIFLFSRFVFMTRVSKVGIASAVLTVTIVAAVAAGV